MAPPTVTSFSPARGHTGGKVFVAFVGTGFKLPDPPPEGVYPAPTPGPSVSVLFDGEEATEVRVEDEETLTCLAPPCPLVDAQGLPVPGTVDIVLTNLDANGDAIAGEQLVLETAFEYLRPDLGAKSFPQWALECLIRQFMLQVVPRVAFAVHTDYRDVDAIDHERIPQAPCLVISDVDFVTNTTQSEQGPQEITLPNGRFVSRRAPDRKDCELAIAGIANTTTEMMSLLVAMDRFFCKTPRLRVPKSIDNADPTAGVLELDLACFPLTPARVTGGGSESNLKTFARGITIVGIPFEDIPGLPNESSALVPSEIPGESVIGTGYENDETVLTVHRKVLPDP